MRWSRRRFTKEFKLQQFTEKTGEVRMAVGLTRRVSSSVIQLFLQPA